MIETSSHLLAHIIDVYADRELPETSRQLCCLLVVVTTVVPTILRSVSMALCVASRCLHEYYGMMMEDQQEDEANVATWYIFYSDKENREYYYQPQTNTASWVLPKGARICPHGDNDNTLECEDTETNEGSSPRESSGPGFSDDNVIDLVECEETSTSKSFSQRFVGLVTRHRFGMALLLLNVFLSSSWIGSVLLSNDNNADLNNDVDIPETITPTMAKIVIAAERLVSEQRLPIPECTVNIVSPPEEKEPQSLFGDLFKQPVEATDQVKEAAQAAASKGNEILQRIEGTVESAGYPIVTRYSNSNSNANHQLIETRASTDVQPCRRPLSRLFSTECRQMHRAQQQSSTDIAPGVRVKAAMDEGLLLLQAAGKNVVRFLMIPRAA